MAIALALEAYFLLLPSSAGLATHVRLYDRRCRPDDALACDVYSSSSMCILEGRSIRRGATSECPDRHFLVNIGLQGKFVSRNFGSASCKMQLVQQLSMKGAEDLDAKSIGIAKNMRGGRVLEPVYILLLTHLLLLSNLTCEARSYGLASPGQRRLLQDVVEYDPLSDGSFTLMMLHRDHEQSPLGGSETQSLSFAQRMSKAANRSTERTQSIRHKIRKSDNGTKTDVFDVQSRVFTQQGEYIAYLHFGTPPQQFAMILDSGSDLAWVQCKPCNVCISEPDPLFDPSSSSSYNDLPCASDFCNDLPSPSPVCSGDTCPFVYEYGDGTTAAGEFGTDTITFGVSSGMPGKIPNFAFGCGTDNSGDLAGSDGILGMGKGPFSLPSQLSELVGNKFSFCLVTAYEATTMTSPLVIGNASFVHAADTTWTPILNNDQNPSFYYIHVKDIKVDGKALDGVPSETWAVDPNTGDGGTIIDTGTTITELLPEAYNALVAKVSNNVTFPTVDGASYGYDICWDTSNATISPISFPSISFEFKWKAKFELPPENAYTEVTVDVYCLTFVSGSGVNIIGNMHLQNFHMFFNNDNNVLGWKPADCDKLK